VEFGQSLGFNQAVAYLPNGLTERQVEELALTGHIHGLDGPVVTVVTSHGKHRDLRNQQPSASNTDIYPATIVWTMHCVGNSRQTENLDTALEEVKTRTGWGRRRRRGRGGWFRRAFRRISRRIGIRRAFRRIVRKAKRAYRAAKEKAKRAYMAAKEKAGSLKGALKSFAKCSLSTAMPLATGNPVAIAKLGACATQKMNEIKDDAKSIVKDAKTEMNVLKNDMGKMAKGASVAAGVTTAHLYKCGENLKKRLKAGKITAAAAIQRLEDQAVIEIINSTVSVNSQMQSVQKHVVKGSQIITKDGLQVAKSAQTLM